jgi:adenosylmethionine-8-amino-7-oxononanoate aminotransferase
VIEQEGADSIAAFIAEPILGTSCCGLTPPPDYFPRIREICDRHDVLMIVDEVVTGFGRTGVNFAIEHFGVVPDIMATGKGLSSGYTPIAATIVRDEIYDAIYNKQSSFVHGHTYGGNPLSCAVALAVQQYIADHDLIDNCRNMGERMLQGLQVLESNPIVGAVRGKGLLTGVEFVADKQSRAPFPVGRGVTAAVVERVLDRKVLIMPGAPGLVDGVAGDHIAISPPFTVTEAQVDETVRAVIEAVEETAKDLLRL